jgi:hypothetical protein
MSRGLAIGSGASRLPLGPAWVINPRRFRRQARFQLTTKPEPNHSGTNVTHSAQICSKSLSDADNASSQS